ncbi:hypothetical protein LIER_31316 [Lithospermum erythrorhizon]|uniref:Gag-pol polyprotein n=1 Tax=Lithospermum erythrorhizon TaxID=34254 RepID=A0AAV3RUD8_LITER
MDLMGPMKVKNIGGKKYVYVCVDDFSRYTWVEFIREKSYTFENAIVERKNMTLQEMARVMLHAKKIPVKCWAEAINKACHIITLRPGQLDEGMTTKKKDKVDYRKMAGLLRETCFIFKVKPIDVKVALLDEQ